MLLFLERYFGVFDSDLRASPPVCLVIECPPPLGVNLELTSLKALHANWLIELYNVLTTADGREAVLNGWKKSGVTAVLKKEKILPPPPPQKRPIQQRIRWLKG